VANSLQLRPILDPLLKNCKGVQVPGGKSASKTWSFYGACKNLVFRKSRFVWVRFYRLISVISRSMFTELLSPNAGGIAVQNLLVRFRISSSVPEIFAAELRSRPKMGQILHVFGP